MASNVDALIRLEEVVISHPTEIEQLPHLTSISRLKLLNIPSNCPDWQWLENVQGLTELEVSITGANVQSKQRRSGRFIVNIHGTKAELSNIDEEETSLAMAKVAISLPENLRTVVSFPFCPYYF